MFEENKAKNTDLIKNSLFTGINFILRSKISTAYIFCEEW